MRYTATGSCLLCGWTTTRTMVDAADAVARDVVEHRKAAHASARKLTTRTARSLASSGDLGADGLEAPGPGNAAQAAGGSK